MQIIAVDMQGIAEKASFIDCKMQVWYKGYIRYTNVCILEKQVRSGCATLLNYAKYKK